MTCNVSPKVYYFGPQNSTNLAYFFASIVCESQLMYATIYKNTSIQKRKKKVRNIQLLYIAYNMQYVVR